MVEFAEPTVGVGPRGGFGLMETDIDLAQGCR